METTRKANRRHVRVLMTVCLIACSHIIITEARGDPSAGNALNVCSYTWSAVATGWRTHPWQPWTCSNGLPVAGAALVGQAQNAAGTSGQSSCSLAAGSHYNHPTFDGATSGTVRCLFVPPASSSFQPSPAMTVCSYTFTDAATGWRTRTWQASDCSNGLPVASSWSIGQAENGTGTEGMPSCAVTSGSHYNHPTWNGATSGTVRCAFVAGGQVPNPEATLCQYTWTDVATGWRTRTWSASDCSHGLPPTNAVAIGSSENGSGSGSMASCDPMTGSHYNHPTQAGATSGTVRCLYAKRPAPASGAGYAFDLNGDGINDANLSFASCNNGSGLQCLVVDSSLFTAQRKIAIGGTDARPASVSPDIVNYHDAIRLIGDHTGDGLAEVLVPYLREFATSTYAPAMAIVDPDIQSVLGNATSPSNVTAFGGFNRLTGDILFPAGPGGRIYPALTPGYGDSNDPPAQPWGWGCLFRAGGSSQDCGAGFIRLTTAPQVLMAGATAWYRESFGHVFDIDGDGWEDLHLPYHGAFLSISGQTGLPLTTTAYDVAAATGAQPVGFHGGRQYGTHRSVAVGSMKRIVIIAGAPVGDLDNPMCNVTHYTAVLNQSGAPSTRYLAWSRFDGFNSNVWPSFPFVPPGSEAPTPSRWGDFADTCIHRYFDSRTIMDGQEALLVNYFAVDWTRPDNAPFVSRCKNEEYQAILDPTPAKQSVMFACFAGHAATKGAWGMKVIRESDGASLTGSQGTYVWGWSTALKTGGETLYLVESLPGVVRFNLKDDAGNRLAPTQLRVYALVNGFWSDRGTLPVAGRPVLLDAPKTGSLGTGDFYGVKTLSLADRDSDGLMDVAVQAADGSIAWIGWSATTSSWIVKP